MMKLFNMKAYRWNLRKQVKKQNFVCNVRDLFFLPRLENHEWQAFSSTKRYLSVLWFVVFVIFFLFFSFKYYIKYNKFNLLDLSYFFNKFVLQIPPSHFLCGFRTFMLGNLCIPAAREYFVYISDPYFFSKLY